MNNGPEKTLTYLEMPAILLMSECLFGAALWKVDPTLWRVATMIPFTAAGMALVFALCVASRLEKEWE